LIVKVILSIAFCSPYFFVRFSTDIAAIRDYLS
jgi:hypothetical protein